MSFRAALERHLNAIRSRDLEALADTVAEDELVLVMSDGRLVRSPREFLEAHRGWFDMPDWTLESEPVKLFESQGLGIAVLRLVYREPPAKREESYLTLAFERRNGKWVMVHDQNTPIR